MNVDLQRQRRNLLLISCGLLLYYFAGVTIGDVSLFGTNLTIQNPHVLVASAWILWLYFTIRYYQYWRAESASEIRLFYKNKLKSFTHTAASNSRIWDAANYKNAPYSVRRNGILPAYFVHIPNVNASTDIKFVEHINPIVFAYWHLRTFLYVAFNTKSFTDYALPFVVAIATPVAAYLVHQGHIRLAT